MEYDTLFSSVPSPTTMSSNTVVDTAPSISNHTLLGFLNALEGYKTKTKELHWASKRFLAQRGNIHELLDDLLDIISDYQDIVAEVGQSFLGVIQFNTFKAIPCDATCPLVLIQCLEDQALELKRNYGNDIKWSGIINATDDYIQNIQQKKYLLQLYFGTVVC